MSMHARSMLGDESTASGTQENVGERPLAGALLGNAAVLVWNDVAENGREQFYAWHDKEHIPERLAIPGFRRGRRFIKPGHSPEWLTMYEAGDLAVVTSPEYLARLNAPTPSTVSTLRYFRNTSRAVCRVVCSVGSSTGGHVLATRLNVSAPRSEAMCRYVRDDLFARMIALTGVVACHLYATDQAASQAKTAESSTRKFDVPSWVLLCEATNLNAAEKAKAMVEGPEFQRLGVICGDAAAYSLEICRLAMPVKGR
jgi:hypothetical protein